VSTASATKAAAATSVLAPASVNNTAPAAAAAPLKFGESIATKPAIGALPAVSPAPFSAPAFAPIAFKSENVIAAKADSGKMDAPLFALSKPAVPESKPVVDVPKSQPAVASLFGDSKSLPSFGNGALFKSEPAPVADSKPLFAALPLAPVKSASEVAKPVVADATKPGAPSMFKSDSAPAGAVEFKPAAPVLAFGLAPKADGAATPLFNFAADKPTVDVTKAVPSVPTPFNFAAVTAPASDTKSTDPIVDAPKSTFGSLNFSAPAVSAITFGSKPLDASTTSAEPPKGAFGSFNFGTPSLPVFGKSDTLPVAEPKIEAAVEPKPDAVEETKSVPNVAEPIVTAEVCSEAPTSPVSSATESSTADVPAAKASEAAVEAPKPVLVNAPSVADDKPVAVSMFPSFGNAFGAQPLFGVKPLSFGMTRNPEPVIQSESKSEAAADVKEKSTANAVASEVQAPVVNAPAEPAETVNSTEPEKPVPTQAPNPAPALAFPSFGSLSFGSALTLSASTSDSSSVAVPVKSDQPAAVPVFGSGALSFPSFRIAEPAAVSSTTDVSPAQSGADQVEPAKVPIFGSGELTFPSFKSAEPVVPAKADDSAKVPVFGTGSLSFPSIQPAESGAVKAEPAPSCGSNIFGSSAVKTETATPLKNAAPEASSLAFGSFGSLSFGESTSKPAVAASNPFLPVAAAGSAPVAVSAPAFAAPAFGSSILAPSKLAIEPKTVDTPAFGLTTFGAAPVAPAALAAPVASVAPSAAPSSGFGVTSTLGATSGFGTTTALGSNAPAFGSTSSLTAFGKTSAFASAAPASFSAQLGSTGAFGAAATSNAAFASSAPASFSAQLGTSNAFGSTGATGFAGFGKTSGAGFGAGFGVNAFATPPAAAANPFLAAQAEATAMGFTDKYVFHRICLSNS
jgi:hypothetical protein